MFDRAITYIDVHCSDWRNYISDDVDCFFSFSFCQEKAPELCPKNIVVCGNLLQKDYKVVDRQIS